MENGEINSSVNSDGMQDSEKVFNGVHNEQTIMERNAQRKLVLHFDIRNTILVADSVTNVDVEEALNTYLTGVTWGYPTADGWCWASDEPSLKPPHDGTVTYYKYLEDRLVDKLTPSNRTLLRQETGVFTQADIGRRFQPCFDKHLQFLRWEHDLVDEKLTMKGKSGARYHYILPAFFQLLRHLRRTSRNFTVVLRTYGKDADNVLRSIEHALAGNHPSVTTPLPITVNIHPGRVRRNDSGDVEFHVRSPDGLGRTVYHRCRDVYEHLNRQTGICGFVDDFYHWRGHGFHHGSGKPLWIDPRDQSVQHLFFDDNIRVSDVDNIVDLRMFEPDGMSTRQLSVDETAIFEDMCLVQNDLLEAAEDVGYFVRKVQRCEEKYDRFIAKRQSRQHSNGVLDSEGDTK